MSNFINSTIPESVLAHLKHLGYSGWDIYIDKDQTRGYAMRLSLSRNLEFNPLLSSASLVECLAEGLKELENEIMDSPLVSEAFSLRVENMRQHLEALQKENNELKKSNAELGQFKSYYDLEYTLRNGKDSK